MSSEAKITSVPTMIPNEERRRGRRSGESRDKPPVVFFCLAETGPEAGPLVLKEKLGSEGEAMVASLKRNEPYYRVEVWKAHAVVNDEVVAIEKEPVKRA
jgi:hypothetical protein